MALKRQKKAILVVSFGTSDKDSLKKTIEQIENEIQNVYQIVLYIVLLPVK